MYALMVFNVSRGSDIEICYMHGIHVSYQFVGEDYDLLDASLLITRKKSPFPIKRYRQRVRKYRKCVRSYIECNYYCEDLIPLMCYGQETLNACHTIFGFY